MIDITPTETGGQFWIHITMDGGELEPRGPFRPPTKPKSLQPRLPRYAGVMHADVRLPATRRRA